MAGTFVPAGAPPPGIVPNFEDPDDTLESAIVATVTVIVSLTTVFTFARLVARISAPRFALEDCETSLFLLSLFLLTLCQIS